MPAAELGRGRIAVSARRDGQEVVIDVIDNGIGLPKENRARLLEPYVTTREKGTGLGLAIVGRILEEHGGRIELRDASEKIPGARGAWMQLRFAAEASDAPTTARPQAQQAAGLTMASDILIVDDEADIRDLVAGILQDEGHGTRTAGDSRRGARRRGRAPAESRVPRHLAARQPARRLATARQAQAATIPNCRS